MEDSWTIDKDGAPSGDPEFWAMRHGMARKPAKHKKPVAHRTGRARTIVRAGLVVLAAVAVSVAL